MISTALERTCESWRKEFVCVDTPCFIRAKGHPKVQEDTPTKKNCNEKPQKNKPILNIVLPPSDSPGPRLQVIDSIRLRLLLDTPARQLDRTCRTEHLEQSMVGIASEKSGPPEVIWNPP